MTRARSAANIGAERYPLSWEAASRYWCFSPDGHVIRVVRPPTGLLRRGPHPHFDPQLEIGADYVLGVWEDALDVQHVRLYGTGR